MTGRGAGREQDGHRWMVHSSGMQAQVLSSPAVGNVGQAAQLPQPRRQNSPLACQRKKPTLRCVGSTERSVLAGEAELIVTQVQGSGPLPGGPFVPLPRVPFPPFPARPFRISPAGPAQGQALMCAWSRWLYFKIRAQTSK